MVAIEKNGEIKIFSTIPNKWNGTNGYNYEDASIHYVDGFRSVIEPTYNTTTQRKGAMIYDEINNVYTYEVINFTAEQLTANEEVVDRNDQEILERKGLNLYQKTKNRLIRRNKKGLITKLRAKKVRELLHPVFLLLKTGDIDIANDKAVLIAVNSNADIEAELDWFKLQLTELLLDVNNLL